MHSFCHYASIQYPFVNFCHLGDVSKSAFPSKTIAPFFSHLWQRSNQSCLPHLLNFWWCEEMLLQRRLLLPVLLVSQSQEEGVEQQQSKPKTPHQGGASNHSVPVASRKADQQLCGLVFIGINHIYNSPYNFVGWYSQLWIISKKFLVQFFCRFQCLVAFFWVPESRVELCRIDRCKRDCT